MLARIRVRAADVLVCLLATVQQLELWTTRRPDATLAIGLVLAGGTLILLARRRAPLLAILVFFGSQAVLIQLLPHGLTTEFFAMLLASAFAGASPGIACYLGWGASALVLAQSAWLDPAGGGLPDFALSVAVMSAFWAAGLLVARSSRSASAMRLELAETRRETIAAERARITRDMHDVVAHGLTVVIVQTVAAQQAVERDAPAADVLGRLRAAEASARDSIADLRRLLTILRRNDDDDTMVPVPGIDGIESLVRAVRATSTEVDLKITGEPDDLEPGLDLAVHRIVQESLTNAVKHAPGARVKVHVRYDQDAVTLEIVDDGGPSKGSGSPGHGLIGMRERVALFGGSLDAGPQPGGGFSVRAELLTEPARR